MIKQPIPKFTNLVTIAFSISFMVASNSKAQRAEDIIFSPAKIKTIPGHGMSKAEYPYDEGGKYRKEWVNTWAKSPVTSSTTVRYPIPKTSAEHSNYGAIAQLQNQNALRNHLQQAKLIAESGRSQNNQRYQVSTPPQTVTVATVPAPRPVVGPMPQPARTTVYRVPPTSTESELIDNGFIGPYDRMAKPARIKPSTPEPIVVARNTYTPSNHTVAASFHLVQKGDTLYNISKRYGTTVDAIKSANGLTSDLIRIGQNLRLAFVKHALGVPRG